MCLWTASNQHLRAAPPDQEGARTSSCVLDDHGTLDLLCSAADDCARAQPPHDVMRTFMLANITALQKKDGRAWHRHGHVFQTFGVEDSGPFSTRAGTDFVGHAIRAATDADHEATVLSIDGVGAYDHVHRSAMLSKFRVSNLCCHACANPQRIGGRQRRVGSRRDVVRFLGRHMRVVQA